MDRKKRVGYLEFKSWASTRFQSILNQKYIFYYYIYLKINRNQIKSDKNVG